MKKQLKSLSQLSRQIIIAHLQKKVYHYEEFDEFYKDNKPAFDDLIINKEEAADFWMDVCNALI